MQPSQFNPVKSAGQGLIAAAQNQFTNPTVTPEMSYTTQTNNLMNGGNPLIEQAKRRAAQEANKRGMIGGSIHSANAADASLQTAAAVAGKDVDAQNQFALNNLSARNQVYIKAYEDQIAEPWRNQAAQENARQFDVSQGNDLKKQEIQLGFTKDQNALDRQQQLGVLDKQYQNQLGLQTNSQSFAGNQAALDRNQQTALLDKQQNFAGSQLDKQQGFAAGQAAIDRQQQTSLLDKQQQFAATQAGADRQHQSSILDQQQNFAGTQSMLDRNERANQFNTTASLDQQRIDAANKTFGQNTFTNYTNQMNAILNNPNLTPAAKKEAQATLNAIYTGKF